MRTLTVAAVAAVAISGVAVAIVAPFGPASAAAGGSTALKLIAVEQHCGGADLPPGGRQSRRHRCVSAAA
jgi:hypothetical protein